MHRQPESGSRKSSSSYSSSSYYNTNPFPYQPPASSFRRQNENTQYDSDDAYFYTMLPLQNTNPNGNHGNGLGGGLASTRTLGRTRSMYQLPALSLTPSERAVEKYREWEMRYYTAGMGYYRGLITFFQAACCTVSMVTVLFCYGLGMYLGHTFSSYPVPYLSYVGAQAPEHYFFIGGLTLSSLMFLPVLALNQIGLVFLRVRTRSVRRLGNAGKIFGFLAALCLSLLSIFDVVDYPTIHYSFAMGFFVFAAVWEFTDAYAHYLWYKEERTITELKRNTIMKAIIFTLTCFVLVLYAFLTLAVSCDFLLDLLNYENCPASHIVAAVAQYCLLLLILTYIFSLRFFDLETTILWMGDPDALAQKRQKRRSKFLNAKNKNKFFSGSQKQDNQLIPVSQKNSFDSSSKKPAPAYDDVVIKVDDHNMGGGAGNLKINIVQDVDSMAEVDYSVTPGVKYPPPTPGGASSRRSSVDHPNNLSSAPLLYPNPSSQRRSSVESPKTSLNVMETDSEDEETRRRARARSMGKKGSSGRNNLFTSDLETQAEEFSESDGRQTPVSLRGKNLFTSRSKGRIDPPVSRSSLDAHTPQEPSAPSLEFTDNSGPVINHPRQPPRGGSFRGLPSNSQMTVAQGLPGMLEDGERMRRGSEDSSRIPASLMGRWKSLDNVRRGSEDGRMRTAFSQNHGDAPFDEKPY